MKTLNHYHVCNDEIWLGDEVIALGPFDCDDVELENLEALCEQANLAKSAFRELSHLVRLMEPLEKEGALNIPGLATLNGARAVLRNVGLKQFI